MKTEEQQQTTPHQTLQVHGNTTYDIKEDKELMKTIWIFLLHKIRYS